MKGDGIVKKFFFKYGFWIIIALVIVYFSFSADHFITFRNFNGLFHAAAPLFIIASGMAFVVFSGKLDISLGSIAYLSTCFGSLLMKDAGLPPVLAFVFVLLTGIVCGAVNAFIIVILRVNPLITTLGTMTAFRGVGLIITQSFEIRMPEAVRGFGIGKWGGIFIVTWVSIIILILLHLVHRYTVFGRQIMAIGNNEEVAKRLGIRVRLITFVTFILAGFLSSIGGIISLSQIGELTTFLGKGVEFTAVAAIVLGGISLFGGEGKILPGVLIGVFVLELIRNGLNHLGANPYLYEFVNGGIIFIAMSADALKARVREEARLVSEEE